jgi:predicted Fe-Mo cluster-binding NifX family protein
MIQKILVPLYKNDVAPRFDLAAEVVIVTIDPDTGSRNERSVVLPRASADQLCHLIIAEDVRVVICGGIEDTYYQYLTWKKVTMIDSVIGASEAVLKRFEAGNLAPGDIVTPS